MPTYERTAEFMRDLNRLTPEQRLAFQSAVSELVEDLKAKRPFRPSLGVKRFKSVSGYWEMAWASDGRALFEFGTSPHSGDAHIIWHRVGSHKIYRS